MHADLLQEIAKQLQQVVEKQQAMAEQQQRDSALLQQELDSLREEVGRQQEIFQETLRVTVALAERCERPASSAALRTQHHSLAGKGVAAVMQQGSPRGERERRRAGGESAWSVSIEFCRYSTAN